MNVPAAAAEPASAERQAELGALPEWDLSDLYPGRDSEALTRDLTTLTEDAEVFRERYEGRLNMLSGAELGAAVEAYEGLQEKIGRIMSYASLDHAGNLSDPEIGRFYQTMQERTNAVSTALLFFTLEINRLDDADLDSKLADTALARYRPWLRDTRTFRPHQLSDDIEKLLHEKHVAGRAAWVRLFDETIADLRFPFRGRDLTESEALDLLSDKDPEVRRQAAQVIGEVLGKNTRVFALITNTLAKDKEIEDRWRRFPRPISSRNLANFVEDEVVDALIAAVRDSYPRLSHRYYRLKARWFGVEELPFWDRNAPLPEEEDRTISWSEAEETVLSAYGAFSPEMAAVGGRFLRRAMDRCAGEARQGVRGFCPSDGAERASLSAAELPGEDARRDDVGARARPRRPSTARQPSRLSDGRHAVDPGGNCLGVRRDADVPRVARARNRPAPAQDHARRQGRRHAEHGRAADRLCEPSNRRCTRSGGRPS